MCVIKQLLRHQSQSRKNVHKKKSPNTFIFYLQYFNCFYRHDVDSAVSANDKGVKGHIKALFLRLGSYVQLFITLIATIYFFPNFFQFVKISFQTFSKGNFLQCGSTVLRTQNVM
jgi:hypothetical protein